MRRRAKACVRPGTEAIPAIRAALRSGPTRSGSGIGRAPRSAIVLQHLHREPRRTLDEGGTAPRGQIRARFVHRGEDAAQQRRLYATGEPVGPSASSDAADRRCALPASPGWLGRFRCRCRPAARQRRNGNASTVGGAVQRARCRLGVRRGFAQCRHLLLAGTRNEQPSHRRLQRGAAPRRSAAPPRAIRRRRRTRCDDRALPDPQPPATATRRERRCG